MSIKTNSTELQPQVALLQTSEDLKTALLIVSVTINLFLFTAWLVIQADPNITLALQKSS